MVYNIQSKKCLINITNDTCNFYYCCCLQSGILLAALCRQPASTDFQDYEILLVDDGSPDRSGEICDEYARKDNRVRVFHKENGGVASARQCGMNNARGEYVIHADPDDWWNRICWRNYTERQKKKMQI